GTGSWGHYAEFSILFTDLIYDPNLGIDIDPCDCSCGVIRLSEAGTYAGGSFNSQKKDGFDILDPSGDLEWRYNSCPEADFVATPDPACEGYAIFFDGSYTVDDYPSYESLNFHWDFGDGNTGEGESLVYIYSTQGIYNVTLTVTDTFGCQDQIVKPVEIITEFEALTI